MEISWLFCGIVAIALTYTAFKCERSDSRSNRAITEKESDESANGLSDNDASSVSSHQRVWYSMLKVALSLYVIFWLFSFQTLKRREWKDGNNDAAATDIMTVFQVHKPLPEVPPMLRPTDCFAEILLMDHVFGWSYGKPFVGKYVPPTCEFSRVTIKFTVTSVGRQFDRLAIMYLGDIEIWRTSTAEPTTDGIVWTYEKDVSAFMSLWRNHQKVIFDLGNLLDDTYTGSFNTTLTATFTRALEVGRSAEQILPISSQQSSDDKPSAFSIPRDVASSLHNIPSNTSRALVSIAACGQASEEFWYSNTLSSLTETFSESAGNLHGYGPFREIQLIIDDQIAGVAWPFPTIFTGGIAPGFWRPIVGLDAFDLAEYQIDITVFLPLLRDGRPHHFEIRVVGLGDDGKDRAWLSQTVGSYWVVTGKIFLFSDGGNSTAHGSAKSAKVWTNRSLSSPSIDMMFYYVQNSTGANETLYYRVNATREFSIISSDVTWSQLLRYSSTNVLTSQGVTQRTKQFTSGRSLSVHADSSTSTSSYFYPLFVNTTYGIEPNNNGFTINASLTRSLTMISDMSDDAVFPLPLSPGIRTRLETVQMGNASYKSVKGKGSFSQGDTLQDFKQDGYTRHVRAAYGHVIEDDERGGSSHHAGHPSNTSLSSCPIFTSESGRRSMRAILGRGPGG